MLRTLLDNFTPESNAFLWLTSAFLLAFVIAYRTFPTILYVADQQKSKIFYSSILNLDPILDVPGMTEFSITENCKLGLMPESGISKILKDKIPNPSSGNGIPRCELYLLVDNPEVYLERALQQGAKLISELSPRDWGDKVGYVSDLDGHVIAFARKI